MFRRAVESSREYSGHHNQNYVVCLTEDLAPLVGGEAGTEVTVRFPRSGVLPVVIRTWRDESEILDAVQGVLPHVPRCLTKGEGYAIHSYVEGVPLSTICGNGKPVDTLIVRALAELLARMTLVRRSALPPLPTGWPTNHTDSQSFLKALARSADQQIRRPNWTAFGGLFTALGLPERALLDFAGRVPAMTRRPFSLLHADLHRDNLIVSFDGEPPLICVDWELATYGDPLHDLATHLVRMQYPEYQWDEVIDAWAEAMLRIRPAAVNGLRRDLPHYLDFERAQSVFPDVMRAAQSLSDAFTPRKLDEATAEVHRALMAAADPLRLRSVPTAGEIESALFRWLASRGDVSGRDWLEAALDWKRDQRFPEHPAFPDAAVRDALLAEGAARADQVFKGTAHLNTVVRVAGSPGPVVVRRKLPHVSRREPSYLSEHAVLRAIQESGAQVAAPKVLALGESYVKDRFTIHTYVGPQGGQPPRHPVNGLLPHEADGLVDQLCALTEVDYRAVDPAAGAGRFHEWLAEQLTLLVRDLPVESLRLARTLGLPDHVRLRQLLSRHQVTDRPPVLLHGDLNPWNLVCRDDRLGVTIIDWEMALVGDPLYDLVRHVHLTPTRPEIKERMVRRWERLLSAEHTKDWQRDWGVYRRIEIVRSAYIDLDRLVTRASLDVPNVSRAVNSYAATLAAATAALGLPLPATANPYLALALA
ncbi:aminoglycoside phosphotransferase family protein [Streptomyces antibioticus]|uniref:Aminoglycoside phosphotransferase family protein n=1 Tax=Streptomyces antibioticus TaxID=1890 RepID=A0AAE6Y8K3_STRAT|nr:aminoglycoside phosphotransferase family protein [Streptomyces antibioticus]OOQ51143.1 phosphotransferase enzyme family protein [Streptomyces antibioticus]QIT45303.1 aminoglycoside phosphotransferase family protein [Streptomyces antibioticus]